MEGNIKMHIKVLDKGFVTLVDHMPRENMDMYVVQCARVSYLGHTKGYEKDMALLKYLLDNKHLAPFEHVQMTFRVRCPLFVRDQWVRHRTASYSIASFRYTEVDETEFYEPEQWRLQANKNKQSSDGLLEDYEWASRYYRNSVDVAVKTYQYLLSQGVAREQARIVLPASMYTTMIVTMDLRNLVWGFLVQRIHPHAQAEIRQYALAILDIVKELAPKTIEYSGLFEEK